MPHRLDYPRDYLDLRYTLTCGQAFRWKLDAEGWWAAPVRGQVIRIREGDSGFLWETVPECGMRNAECGIPARTLRLRSGHAPPRPPHSAFRIPHSAFDYFRLGDDLQAIYERLAQADGHLAELVERFRGLRLLRQEPEETIISFVCSTANSVPRISTAIEELSRRYGQMIAEVGGRAHYSFPRLGTLAEADPDELAAVPGLAWRGRNVSAVARQIVARPPGWLDNLRTASYGDARSELLALRGIGRKIADCVCLFALDKDEAVPVDTHVRQIAVRFFLPELKTRTLTPAVYDKIVGVFREKFNTRAGWAQQFLYYEDLKK